MRRVVTRSMRFHLDDGREDNWQPGDQFEVEQITGDRVICRRAHSTGWVEPNDLAACSQEIPPLTARHDRHGNMIRSNGGNPKCSTHSV